MNRAVIVRSFMVACSLLLSAHVGMAGEGLRSTDGVTRVSGTMPLKTRTSAWQIQVSRAKRANAPDMRAPLAFQLYCLKNIDACRNAPDTKVAHNQASMSKIRSVNIAVNRSIRPKYDHGRDSWNDNVRAGDCEDFALAKRRKLIELGFPVGALRIAIARTNRGEGHAVLIVRTKSGEMVLDNRTNSIKPWSRTTLTKVKMSGANPLEWR